MESRLPALWLLSVTRSSSESKLRCVQWLLAKEEQRNNPSSAAEPLLAPGNSPASGFDEFPLFQEEEFIPFL